MRTLCAAAVLLLACSAAFAVEDGGTVPAGPLLGIEIDPVPIGDGTIFLAGGAPPSITPVNLPSGDLSGLGGDSTGVTPEPATLSLLALGALAVLRRKR